MPLSEQDKHVLTHLLKDLQRQAKWSEIIGFLETHNREHMLKKQSQSPAIYAKNKRWLLNTERLTLLQVLVFQYLRGNKTMSQGEMVRLLGGNPNRKNLSATEKKEVKILNQYWINQIRNNIQPILADYFGLLIFDWVGGNKPGQGGYKIRVTDLLLQFFRDIIYQE